MDVVVKQELSQIVDCLENNQVTDIAEPTPLIEFSSSDDSDSDSYLEGDMGGYLSSWRKRSGLPGDDEGDGNGLNKKRKPNDMGVILPLGFLDPLPPEEPLPLPEPEPLQGTICPAPSSMSIAVVSACKQFWKAGDFEGRPSAESTSFSAGMDHVRVHPKFLHSNATSHKWALGAFAELLDNSLDEVMNGATYVNIDMLENQKDKSKMLLIEDNGGGMGPDKMRQCMSLGYSAKSKMANTIGQYGNGFKTSTMRLGADVIVFSRCHGTDGKSPTQSIGLLSYTFLRGTCKEDIVVPMLNYEKEGKGWKKMIRLSPVDWDRNAEAIVQWSPYSSEVDLLQQFNSMEAQGTRIIIYNLWEDDQGHLELDFGTDRHDIQIRGVNRDEKKIQMAKQFPNSKHFLTYTHSLRSYASILYLRLPPRFRMILRGKDIEHHSIVNDMMFKQEITYRPAQIGVDGASKDSNKMVAVVTIGFVKDAKDHIDIQGFNVYHKNRLIKPFWRVWSAAGSGGRGVIGVLEANFVEPAHDKQGFERTTVLQRLETRLVQMQKTYWGANCHKIGYAPHSKKISAETKVKETSSEVLRQPSSRSLTSTSPSCITPLSTRLKNQSQLADTQNSQSFSNSKQSARRDHLSVELSMVGGVRHANGHVSIGMENGKAASKFGKKISSPQTTLRESSPSVHKNESHPSQRPVNGCNGHNISPATASSQKDRSCVSRLSMPPLNDGEKERSHGSTTRQTEPIASQTQLKAVDDVSNGSGPCLEKSNVVPTECLEQENLALKERLMKLEESMSKDLQFERDRNKSLENQIDSLKKQLEEANKEQEALIDIFSEERNRRDREEENLRKKLKDASVTIQELLEEKMRHSSNGVKQEH